MTDVPHADAMDAVREVRREQMRYEAFLHGYVQGRQDQEAEKVIAGPRDLRERTEELFERVEDREGWDD